MAYNKVNSISTICSSLSYGTVLQKYLAGSTIRRMALRDYVPQNAMIAVRMRLDELATIKKAAKNAGKSVSGVARELLLAWAKRNGK